MSIYNFFRDLELTNDQTIAVKKLENFLMNDEHIFMLKGYAGTGKTTIIAGLVKYLNAIKRPFEVMAPTGRAAKILKNKTGVGSTIHKCIYKLESVDVEENTNHDENTSIKINFPILLLEKENSVLIIDESSMVSSKESKQAILSFGTDVLLKDLLTYAQIINKKTKIIFVGDSAQLLPVGDNKSWAFEKSLFTSKNFEVNEYELKEIKRQEKNLILDNSIIMREAIENENLNELVLKYDQKSFEKLGYNEVLSTFLNETPIPELNSSIIITYSNGSCFEYNNAIRNLYFPSQGFITTGDIIQITNNAYLGEIEINNGDFAKIIEVSNTVDQISAPVFVDDNGKRIKKIIKLDFRDVIIKLDTYSELIPIKIVDSLLYSQQRDLSYEEQTAIYIHFLMRFQEKQNALKEQGLEYSNVESKTFKDELLSDPYINAIRCKFGYAITCHKAQGGEWDKVFVDYTGRVSLNKEPLRWCYTATTRGISKVYAINPPHFTKFKKFEIGNTTKISKMSKESIVFQDIVRSPFHSENQHICKSKKYWDVLELIEDTNYSIKNVLSKDYLERYTVEKNAEITVLEGYHNGNGFFDKPFKIVTGTDQNLLEIFNQPVKINYKLNYKPSTINFEELFSYIQSICLEYNIYISNVVESIENNYINYYFISDNFYSNIQFYFNKEGNLTKALPKTNDIEKDIKFSNLLTKLKELSNE